MSSTVRPFLPPEIIHEILRSEELDQYDLANCCLVNRAWVDSARKSLYNDLTIGLVLRLLRSDADEETERGDIATLVKSYYLDPPSSLILSTLLSNRRLRPLVRAFSYRGEISRKSLSDDNVIWMQPPDVITTFARLCPLATALSFRGFYDLSGKGWEALRLHCESLTRLELAAADQEYWEELRHFKNLLSFKTSWTELPEPPFCLPPLGLSLVSFCVSDFFRPNDFKAIPSSTWRSLRHLQVPIMMVPEIRSLHFPHLHRLVLTIGDHIPESMTSLLSRAVSSGACDPLTRCESSRSTPRRWRYSTLTAISCASLSRSAVRG